MTTEFEIAQITSEMNNNTDFASSDSTNLMHRVSSLYVHNPYGRGDMVRLAGEKMRKAAEGITITVAEPEDDAAPMNVVQPVWGQGLASPACSSNGLSACDSDSHSCQSHSEGGSEKRKRSKKPRKNRSAGLVNDNGERVSVCLDFLKGVCNRKRSRCKFAHPQLSLDAPAPVTHVVAAPSHVRVCEVWALTGFCKFGSRCRDYHPAVEEPITKVCAPATTVRMTTASREAARRMSECSWSEDGLSADESSRPCTPPPAAMVAPTPQPAFMQSWYEVEGLIVNLNHYNFDATLKRLVGLLTVGSCTIDSLMPIMMNKTVDNFERLASLMSMMCRNLCDLYPEAQRYDFQCQLLRLVDRVLHMTPEGHESDEQLMAMARRQRGSVAFLGELFKQNLVPAVRLQSALDHCTKRAMYPTDEGNLHTELACMLLRIVGPAAQSVLDLDHTLKHLNEAVAMHQQRTVQMQMPQQQMWGVY